MDVLEQMAAKKLVERHLIDMFQEGRTELAAELFTDDFIDHNPGPGQRSGIEGYQANAMALRIAFPDQRYEILKVLVSGDHIVDHWRMRATHTGPLMGYPATGRKIDYHGTDILRIEGGRIAETWHVEEIAAVLTQLGLVDLDLRQDEANRPAPSLR